MRAVPSPVSCDLSPGKRRIWRETTGPANLPSAVGHGALRRVRLRRGAGQRRGGQRPAPVRYRARGSGPGCPATCGESPHHPRPLQRSTARPFNASPCMSLAHSSRVSAEAGGLARRRCALEAVRKVVTALPGSPDPRITLCCPA
jgi:hypothetical protein